MNRQEHWNAIYATKSEQDVSWFETLPAMSIQMLESAGLTHETCVIDVGGGNSRLVDELVKRGLDCLAVLDVSGAALEHARQRLGPAAAIPIWLQADVTNDWSLRLMDIWHDRAVFHFLITPEDRARYRASLHRILKPKGTAIIATFAPDGPEKCSGLPVEHYSPETLAAELGEDFALLEGRPYVHTTPSGITQSFQYSRLVRVA